MLVICYCWWQKSRLPCQDWQYDQGVVDQLNLGVQRFITNSEWPDRVVDGGVGRFGEPLVVVGEGNKIKFDIRQTSDDVDKFNQQPR